MSVEGVEGDVLNMVAFDFLGASYDLKILVPPPSYPG